MTVKEIFDLRKQGRVEEAYEAIRPMYAVHQGKYTTLCMFWTANDILKKRVKENRIDEAEKIFKALLRILPNIEDADGKAHSSILHDAVLLAKESEKFSMLDFVSQLKVETLRPEDWKPSVTSVRNGNGNHPIPGIAEQMLTQAFHEIQQTPTTDNALKVMPLLHEAVRQNPRNKHNQRYMAVVYVIMGEREKAISIYQQLLSRYKDSYLYAELADLTDEIGLKAALLCQAIRNQRQEVFNTGYRLGLARLLMDRDKPKAAHELQKYLAVRNAQGQKIPHDVQNMISQLGNIQPTTDTEQQTFYKKMAEKYKL